MVHNGNLLSFGLIDKHSDVSSLQKLLLTLSPAFNFFSPAELIAELMDRRLGGFSRETCPNSSI